MFKKFLLLLMTFYIAPTHASLLFTVDNITTDEFTFSINGSFDEDTVGIISPGMLAIKYDWSNNFGVHTEFMDGHAAVTSSSLAVNGMILDREDIIVGSTMHSTSDSIYFHNPLGSNVAFEAGTLISGSATLELLDGFDPSLASGLELLSGYTMAIDVIPVFKYDWARLEATAQVLSTPPPVSSVPAPAPLWLLGIGLMTLASGRKGIQITQ